MREGDCTGGQGDQESSWWVAPLPLFLMVGVGVTSSSLCVVVDVGVASSSASVFFDIIHCCPSYTTICCCSCPSCAVKLLCIAGLVFGIG